MAVTRCALSTSLEGKERDKEDHDEDVNQVSGPRDCSAPRTTGPGQPFPGVPDSGGGIVTASTSASSSLYSSISTVREDGGKEAHIEEVSVEGRGEV